MISQPPDQSPQPMPCAVSSAIAVDTFGGVAQLATSGGGKA